MKQNSLETGFMNASTAEWIPPTITFVTAPQSPATGVVYLFTDALTPGADVGGGSSLSTCRWDGTKWVAVTGGTAGPQGPAGPTGPKGDQGIQGPTGAQGPAGSTGPAGAQGAQGPAGPAGKDGATGPQGPQGVPGNTGATGPQGPIGNTGATGPQGPIGPAGPEGPEGPPGTSIEIKGSVPTAGDLPQVGAPGDAWIAADTGHLWVWTATGWLDAGQIQGPAGPEGPAGPQGPKGDPGPIGQTGATGATGAQGPVGATGPQGIQGPIGLTGDTGPQGIQGIPGTTGAQGPVGPAGAAGAQGPKGDTGDQGIQGIQGPAGVQGPKGDPGAAGATGPQGPQGPPATIQDEGVILTQRTTLNFVGAGVTAVDDPNNGRTVVTIPGGSTLPAGSSGQVQFNSNNAFGASANLFWDAGNSRLGIGTTSPQVALHVIKAPGLSAPPPAGTYSGTAIIGGDSTAYGVYIGSLASNGYGYIQAQRGDSATTYPLMLNPNGGNVGVGNDGTGLAFSGYPQVIVGPTTNTGKTGLIMACGNATASGTAIGDFSGVNWAIAAADKRIGSFRFDIGSTPDTGHMVFTNWQAGVAYERMRITPPGSVGIGTSLPYAHLTVSGGGQNNSTGEWTDSGAQGGALLLDDSTLSGYGGGTFLVGCGGKRFAAVRGNYQDSSNNGVGHLQFLTRTNSTDTSLTVKMTLTNLGRLGIGTNNPGYSVDVAGDINTTTGYFRVAGSPIPRIKAYFDQGGLRALNTVYQNNNGVPMFVSATVSINAGQYAQLLTDLNNPPGRVAFAQSNAAGAPINGTVNGWVMPGDFYRVVTPSGSLVTWYEWI